MTEPIYIVYIENNRAMYPDDEEHVSIRMYHDVKDVLNAVSPDIRLRTIIQVNEDGSTRMMELSIDDGRLVIGYKGEDKSEATTRDSF